MRKLILILALALLLCICADGATKIGLDRLNWSQRIDGIKFSGTAPTSSAGFLYNDSGNLKFNGSTICIEGNPGKNGVTVGNHPGCDFVADGINDDVTVQEAMDFIEPTGGVLYILGGFEYHFTNGAIYNLSKSSSSSIEIVGIGRPRIFMDGTGPAINMSGNFAGSSALSNYLSVEHAKRPTIRGLEIIGTTSTSDGIVVNRCFNPLIADNFIYDSRYGITLKGKNNRNAVVSNNHVTNCTYGVFFSGTNLHQVTIKDNFLQYNKRSIFGGNDNILHNLEISGNDIEGSSDRADTDYMVLLTDCMENDFRFVGNTMEQHGSPSGTIGLAVLNTTASAETHSFIINSNTFSWIPSNAIYLSNCTSVEISSNNFQACSAGGYSLNLAKVSGLNIIGNVARFDDWGYMGGWNLTLVSHATISGNHITLLKYPVRIISSASTTPISITGNTFGSTTGFSGTDVLWISSGAIVANSNAISSSTGAAYGMVVDGTVTGIVAANRASAGTTGNYSIASGPIQAYNV